MAATLYLAVDVVLDADGKTLHVTQVRDDENDGDVRMRDACTKGAVLATTADACEYSRTTCRHAVVRHHSKLPRRLVSSSC